MINSINLPKKVLLIINVLEKHGFECYVVGGCVRDSLLGIIPKDWDICTSAKPKQIIKALSQFTVIPTGIKYGTVTAIIDNQSFEITTYRKESNYINNRKPKDIAFVNSLKQDLKRRDFTINSMAYHPNTKIIDYFGGIDDLKKGIVRCVSDPYERFEEDAIRILRAVRFCSVFGFKPDDNTKKAMLEKKLLLNNISNERISSEFCKALLGKYISTSLNEFSNIIAIIIPELAPIINSDYKIYENINIWESILFSIYNSKPVLLVRLCLLFKYIGIPNCLNISSKQNYLQISSDIAEKIATRLQISKQDIKTLKKIIQYQNDDLLFEIEQICFKLNELGTKVYSLLLQTRQASSIVLNEKDKKIATNHIEKSQELLTYIINNNICYCIEQLNINGKDLINLGYKQGPIIKSILKKLLKEVINGNLQNTHEQLLNYANKLKTNIN